MSTTEQARADSDKEPKLHHVTAMEKKTLGRTKAQSANYN